MPHNAPPTAPAVSSGRGPNCPFKRLSAQLLLEPLCAVELEGCAVGYCRACVVVHRLRDPALTAADAAENRPANPRSVLTFRRSDHFDGKTQLGDCKQFALKTLGEPLKREVLTASKTLACNFSLSLTALGSSCTGKHWANRW